MSETSTTRPAWCGWVKSVGGPWRLVCDGRDHGEVWSRLMSHVIQGAHVERLVLKAGQVPTQRRPR